jgi:hypothetical protein
VVCVDVCVCHLISNDLSELLCESLLLFFWNYRLKEFELERSRTRNRTIALKEKLSERETEVRLLKEEVESLRKEREKNEALRQTLLRKEAVVASQRRETERLKSLLTSQEQREKEGEKENEKKARGLKRQVDAALRERSTSEKELLVLRERLSDERSRSFSQSQLDTPPPPPPRTPPAVAPVGEHRPTARSREQLDSRSAGRTRENGDTRPNPKVPATVNVQVPASLQSATNDINDVLASLGGRDGGTFRVVSDNSKKPEQRRSEYNTMYEDNEITVSRPPLPPTSAQLATNSNNNNNIAVTSLLERLQSLSHALPSSPSAILDHSTSTSSSGQSPSPFLDISSNSASTSNSSPFRNFAQSASGRDGDVERRLQSLVRTAIQSPSRA